MNSQSPLIPQGSNLEQQNKARSSLKVKIFCALGVNVAVLLVLLMQGCKREQPAPPPETILPIVDTNTPTVVDTNPVPMAVETNVAPQVPVVETHAAPTTPTGSAQEYTIAAGDSFYTIGKKFGVSIKAIAAANPTVDPKKLQVGKTLHIPAPEATGVTATAGGGGSTTVDVASGDTTYTVKSGDTLGKLATEFHTTVKAIQSANNLTDTRIKVGQKLKIPAKSTTP